MRKGGKKHLSLIKYYHSDHDDSDENSFSGSAKNNFFLISEHGIKNECLW